MAWVLREERAQFKHFEKTLEQEVLHIHVTELDSQINRIDFYAIKRGADGYHSRADFTSQGEVDGCRMGFLIAPDGMDLYRNGFKRYVPHFEELPDELKAIVLSDVARGSGIYERERRIA